MRELKATDKITQKMTRDGAVSENLATGEVEHISNREPETELSASSEESAGMAADLAHVVVKHFCNTLFENSPGISSFKWCFPIIVGMRTDMIVPYVHISV